MENGIEGTGPGRRPSAWASAKVRLLRCWDHPPAVLFWLAFTVAAVAALKIAGL